MCGFIFFSIFAFVIKTKNMVYGIIIFFVIMFIWAYLVYLSEETKWKRIHESFKPGLLIRDYEITGHVFLKEKLLYEALILGNEDGYMLLKNTKTGLEYEWNITNYVKYCDKIEIVDGNNKVIKTYGNAI